MLSFFKNLLFHGEGAEDIGGPVLIVSVLTTAARQSIELLLLLMMLISVNLGVVNLLPLPALDGGRLVFILIEWIVGKPVPKEKEGIIHFIGLILLMGVFVFFSIRDIISLFGG